MSVIKNLKEVRRFLKISTIEKHIGASHTSIKRAIEKEKLPDNLSEKTNRFLLDTAIIIASSVDFAKIIAKDDFDAKIIASFAKIIANTGTENGDNAIIIAKSAENAKIIAPENEKNAKKIAENHTDAKIIAKNESKKSEDGTFLDRMRKLKGLS